MEKFKLDILKLEAKFELLTELSKAHNEDIELNLESIDDLIKERKETRKKIKEDIDNEPFYRHQILQITKSIENLRYENEGILFYKETIYTEREKIREELFQLRMKHEYYVYE